jgi:hypothetical protein
MQKRPCAEDNEQTVIESIPDKWTTKLLFIPYRYEGVDEVKIDRKKMGTNVVVNLQMKNKLSTDNLIF